MWYKRIMEKADNAVWKLDRVHLWCVGFVVLAVNFFPILKLKEGCVFPWHDQLDETLLTYVLNGKHLGTGFLPELLGGISAGGMQPSAILFVPLYRWLSPLNAFLIQYAIVFAAAFFGMYFCIKEITGSSILSAVAGSCFCLLPAPPVYGLSVTGVPLALYCILCLHRKKHLILNGILLLFLGLTSHLVLTGYAILALWGMFLLWQTVKKRSKTVEWLGFGWLTFVYALVNRRLFLELLLGKAGYVSHREEMVNYASPLWTTIKDVFLNSAQHAESLHKYLILPILFLLVFGGAGYKRMGMELRRRYLAALGGLAVLAGIAVFYGLCKWQPIVDLKNERSGFLRYFQMERFYWLYPAGWLAEFFVCFSIWWGEAGDGRKHIFPGRRAMELFLLLILLMPTIGEIKVNSYFYLNVNQINNGSKITGYISWESYYSEELMQTLENIIGRDMTSYRIAHLGISPAPALMHGFYTVDGYSNNYPLEYKHRFRQVIAKELEKNEQTALYFDQWGSRCYLFNGATGNAWMLGKDQHIVYEKPELDTEALKGLECEYVFSCGEILNAQELGLRYMGYYETEVGYWGIWLYELIRT